MARDGRYLVVVGWFDLHRALIKKRRYDRSRKGSDPDAHVPLSYIGIPTKWNGQVQDLCEIVGGEADAYIARLHQYVAMHGFLHGAVIVSPEAFGPRALSTDFHYVPSKDGIYIHEMMLDVGLIVRSPTEPPIPWEGPTPEESPTASPKESP